MRTPTSPVSWGITPDVTASLAANPVERNASLFAAADTAPESDTFAAQLLYSYKVNPQTVFFAGYSDDYADDDGGSLRRSGRALFIKLAYAWLP